jgi:hypothetical protein
VLADAFAEDTEGAEAGGLAQGGAGPVLRVEGGRVRLQSRQQRPLTRCFPEIVTALGEHFTDVTLYGVIWGREWGVHHVADRPLSLLRSSLWTAYLWSVHDGCRPAHACSTRPRSGVGSAWICHLS